MLNFTTEHLSTRNARNLHTIAIIIVNPSWTRRSKSHTQSKRISQTNIYSADDFLIQLLLNK